MTAIPVAGARESPVANPLFEYLLRLADDRLVLGHRVSEWCGRGPMLEEDIALSNVALDLIGQASALLKLAGAVEGQGRDEDALAFFRDEIGFRNALLVELPTGDFGFTIARQFLFDTYSVLLWDTLQRSAHQPLAAIAAKALKEDKYHLRHSSDWMLKLGDGSSESHAKVQGALAELSRFTGELFEGDAVDASVRNHGIVVDHVALRSRWEGMVTDVLRRATLTLPGAGSTGAGGAAAGAGGRRGRHTEFLGHMLSEMQIVARSHPGARW